MNYAQLRLSGETFKEYKSRDLIKLNCTFCTCEHTRSKKSITSDLKNPVSLNFCGVKCLGKYKTSIKTVKCNCNQCGAGIQIKLSKLTKFNYCSQKCSATFNNTQRVRSEESKKKMSDSIKEYYKNNPREKTVIPKEKIKNYPKLIKEKQISNSRPIMTRIGWCCWCKNMIVFPQKTHRIKSCSPECIRKYRSEQQTERLKNNPDLRKNMGRQNKSYLELSFEKWLTDNNIKDYEMEKHFRNTRDNKSYYSDFYFNKLNVIIELDGTQHKKTVEEDRIRDEYIKSEYGVTTILRITHKEYQSKSRIEEIKKLLCVI